MNSIYIFGGGSIDPDFVRKYMAEHSAENFKIIAADAGLNTLHAMGMKPDVILGDFDSVKPEWLSDYQNDESIHFERFPAHKDYTDMELAVDMAIQLGAEEILIFGATGTRLDHVIGNIFSLQRPMEQGITAKLLDPHNVIQLLGPGAYTVNASELPGKYVSFLPYTECVTGISLTGFLYPLHEYEMVKGTTLGISNELASDQACVSFREGILVFIQSAD